MAWLALGRKEEFQGDQCQRAGNRTAALIVQAATGLANAHEPLTNHANFRIFMMPPLIHAGSAREGKHFCTCAHAHAPLPRARTIAIFGKDFVAVKSYAK